MEQCTVPRPSASFPIPSTLQLTFHRRQTQLLCNFRIPNPPRLLQRHPLHQFRQIARTSDGTPAPKRLELDIRDALRRRVHANLQLHNVAARRRANQASADIDIRLGHAAHVSGSLVVIDDFLVV